MGDAAAVDANAVDAIAAVGAVLLLAAVTLATRVGGVWLMSCVRITPRVETFLKYMSVSVLIAIVAPATWRAGPHIWLGVAAAALVMGSIGTTALAAHQIALQTAAVMFMVPFGISLAATVREAIRSVDKGASILSVTTVENRLGELGAQRRLNTWLLALFAALALALTMIGIYGTMHYTVAQRTHEIGIRLALGARATDVLRLIIGQGMKLTLVGVAVGLLAALWLTSVMAHLLFGVSAHDPVTFAGVALALAGVALLACYLPARKATKVDPIVVLRYE